MTAGTAGKPCRARKCLAGGDDTKPALHLVADRSFFIEIPLPQRGTLVIAQTGLRKPCEIMRQRNGMLARLAFWHKTIGEADIERFARLDRPARQDQVH